MAHDLARDGAGFDVARPADEAGDAESAFPVGVFFTAERGHRAIGPGVLMGAIVARVDDDCVFRDAEVVERFEERADRVVVLDHAVEVFAIAVFVAAAVFGAHMGAKVHAGGVEPDEEWFAGRVLALHEVDRARRRFRRRLFPSAFW